MRCTISLIPYMHVYLRNTFIPYMHVDLRLFLNKNVFKQVIMNVIVESSKKALKNGDNLKYLKCDFKYVIERRTRIMTVEKKGKKRKEM